MTTDGGIVVTGTGGVDVEPDVVHADLGVSVSGPDLSEALPAAEQGLARIRDGLLARGVERRDLRTTQTSIWHEDRTNEAGEPAPSRVHVRLGLRVVLRDLGASGAQVHAALADGGHIARIDSLTFAVSEPEQAQVRARAAAFADARHRAEQYASLAGRALGAVVQVVEGGANVTPMPKARMMAAAPASMPVEGGEQTVGASVTVHWAWAAGTSGTAG
ncbi:DUF541 domain-containing protein [Occultella glacieicola]|uniref:DUF541 domain-containing protein n=1 Tax=Occultella glacieicola TaxID=2518684 RepID=A0ABY2E557_9MICO|nr:SIMPL domain-containing protein [Occultella glacieicola]TDE93982.1 DUF541 domain-containing protein [Occultella glacieicola]